jgi:hypothetical protein
LKAGGKQSAAYRLIHVGFLLGSQSAVCCLLHVDFLLGLLFNPEDVGDMFLRNVGCLSPDYTALYPKRQKSSPNISLAPSSQTSPMHINHRKL